MDRTIKVLLGIIALSLVTLNCQMAGVGPEREANAQYYGTEEPCTERYAGETYARFYGDCDRPLVARDLVVQAREIKRAHDKILRDLPSLITLNPYFECASESDVKRICQ